MKVMGDKVINTAVTILLWMSTARIPVGYIEINVAKP
jgi:hypothetical protein